MKKECIGQRNMEFSLRKIMHLTQKIFYVSPEVWSEEMLNHNAKSLI